MTNQLEIVQGKVFEVVGVTDMVIARLSEQYLPLKISGIEDKEGYDRVHSARMVVKGTRVKVEKKGKEIREEAVKYQKAVIAEEKRIIGLLEPIETHLLTEEKTIDDALEAIKVEEKRKEEERIQSRRDRLAALGIGFNGHTWLCDLPHIGIKALPDVMVRTLTDAQFEEEILFFNAMIKDEAAISDEETAKFKAEADRLFKVAAEQEVERQRLTEIARKQEEEADRLKTEQKKIDNAKQKAIDDAKRAEELEIARKEGAEKALKDAEEFARQNALKLAEQERLAKIAEEKKAARRPDKVKLLAFADTMETLVMPEMKTDEGTKAIIEFFIGLTRIIKILRDKAEAL